MDSNTADSGPQDQGSLQAEQDAKERLLQTRATRAATRSFPAPTTIPPMPEQLRHPDQAQRTMAQGNRNPTVEATVVAAALIKKEDEDLETNMRSLEWSGGGKIKDTDMTTTISTKREHSPDHSSDSDTVARKKPKRRRVKRKKGKNNNMQGTGGNTLDAIVNTPTADVSTPITYTNTPATPVTNKKDCANCNIQGHSVTQCTVCDEDGYVSVCILCNDAGHYTLSRDCPTRKGGLMNRKKAFNICALGRHGKPPVKLDWYWWELGIGGFGVKPQTPAFAKERFSKLGPQKLGEVVLDPAWLGRKGQWTFDDYTAVFADMFPLEPDRDRSVLPAPPSKTMVLSKETKKDAEGEGNPKTPIDVGTPTTAFKNTEASQVLDTQSSDKSGLGDGNGDQNGRKVPNAQKKADTKHAMGKAGTSTTNQNTEVSQSHDVQSRSKGGLGDGNVAGHGGKVLDGRERANPRHAIDKTQTSTIVKQIPVWQAGNKKDDDKGRNGDQNHGTALSAPRGPRPSRHPKRTSHSFVPTKTRAADFGGGTDFAPQGTNPSAAFFGGSPFGQMPWVGNYDIPNLAMQGPNYGLDTFGGGMYFAGPNVGAPNFGSPNFWGGGYGYPGMGFHDADFAGLPYDNSRAGLQGGFDDRSNFPSQTYNPNGFQGSSNQASLVRRPDNQAEASQLQQQIHELHQTKEYTALAQKSSNQDETSQTQDQDAEAPPADAVDFVLKAALMKWKSDGQMSAEQLKKLEALANMVLPTTSNAQSTEKPPTSRQNEPIAAIQQKEKSLEGVNDPSAAVNSVRRTVESHEDSHNHPRMQGTDKLFDVRDERHPTYDMRDAQGVDSDLSNRTRTLSPRRYDTDKSAVDRPIGQATTHVLHPNRPPTGPRNDVQHQNRRQQRISSQPRVQTPTPSISRSSLHTTHNHPFNDGGGRQLHPYHNNNMADGRDSNTVWQIRGRAREDEGNRQRAHNRGRGEFQDRQEYRGQEEYSRPEYYGQQDRSREESGYSMRDGYRRGEEHRVHGAGSRESGNITDPFPPGSGHDPTTGNGHRRQKFRSVVDQHRSYGRGDFGEELMEGSGDVKIKKEPE